MSKKDIKGLILQLQNEIEYCATCQPYDDGDVVWVLGVQNSLESLFDEYDIPENIRDEIAHNLRCPSCGRQFERYDDYGEKTEYEKQVDQKHEEWLARYKNGLEDFIQFIEKYPYLGAKHELGEKIIELMPEFPATIIENENWFRARKISNGRIFSHNDMIAPNPEQFQIGEGRFNHYGQSHFYLAKTALGAAKELLAYSDEKMVWMQNVIIHNANTILDVRVGFHEPDPDAPLIATGLIYFSGALNSGVERNKYWKPEYFIPRFVADAAKLTGFQGILYTSAHHYSDNLVIFDTSKLEHEFKDNPYTFILPDEQTEFPILNELFDLPS